MGFFDDSAGGIAGAIGSVAGGALGLIGNSQTNAANAAAANLSYEQQKEFAQNGIRWRVADAKAAGIHPLAALGAMPANYTPAASVANSPDYSFLADAGQNIGRAMDAKRTQEERAAQQVTQDVLAGQQIESNRLDNEYKQTLIDQTKQDMVLQLARSAEMAARTQQQVPAMPSLGKTGGLAGQAQFATGETKKDVSEVPTAVRGDPGTQAGRPPDARRFVSSDGGSPVLPLSDFSDAADAVPGLGLQWFIRNSFVPWLANYLPIEDNRRQKDEYYDIIRGGYYKTPSLRDFFGY